jgi:hypothetical protein
MRSRSLFRLPSDIGTIKCIRVAAKVDSTPKARGGAATRPQPHDSKYGSEDQESPMPELRASARVLGSPHPVPFGTLDCVQLRTDHLVSERISQKFGIGVDVERLHHPILVKGNGAWFDVDHICDLLHRQTFGKQL